MKRTCLCHAKARKKILIPTITALLITAQLSPVAIAGMSESELRGCLTGLPKTVVVAEASTTAEKNSAELQEKYGITKATGVTSDYKYGKRTSAVTREITYHKTLEGLENNKELREALKEMLGISSYLPVDMVGKNEDGTAIPISVVISWNYFNVKDLLSTNSGRKQLAQLGEKYTDWIDADWAEAADLTVMAAFGVVNDDYNLIKYNKNTRTDKISRQYSGQSKH